MAVALRGNLQDFGIAEVFQLIGQQRKTGLLKISNGGREVCLAFDAGSVVWATPVAEHEHEILGKQLIRSGYLTAQRLAALHAEAKPSGRSLRALMLSDGGISEQDLEAVDSLLTGNTIFDVLRWSDGSFHFLSQAVTHDRPPEKLLGAEQILMDGLRMVDEWQTFHDRVPPLDSIPECSGSIDEFRQQARHGGASQIDQFERIYQLVDGRMTLQRVIDLSRLGLFDANRVIAELVQAGLITAVENKNARGGKRRIAAGRSLGHQLVGAMTAIVPLLLLGAMVYWISLQGAARPERIEAFPIDRQIFDQANALFEKRRIRHALEAHRYLTGAWPDQLVDLDASGLLGDQVMAVDPRPAYYYARSGNDIVLLAPER